MTAPVSALDLRDTLRHVMATEGDAPEDVAAACDVSVDTVQRWLSGDSLGKVSRYFRYFAARGYVLTIRKTAESPPRRRLP